jgi:tRNA(fMet)-specific endonuclease VapC
MKPSMLDTDILSEFLRGNPQVIDKVEEHLIAYGFISLSIITYYEILKRVHGLELANWTM